VKFITFIAIGDQPSLFQIAAALNPRLEAERFLIWDRVDHLGGGESPQVWQLSWIFPNAGPAQRLADLLTQVAIEQKWEHMVACYAPEEDK